jgi:single-strand DNA-binding protein
MTSVNKVILIGHVGRDPELRVTQGGKSVANFSLATNNGEGNTEWHSIVVWERQAEIADQYVRKGKQLYIEGRLQTRNWTDPQGVKHYKTEIVCHNLQLLGSKDTADNGDAPVDEYDIGEIEGAA